MGDTAEAEARIEHARQAEATVLNLGGLGLTALPDTLRDLTGLRSLSVADSELAALPDWLGELDTLVELNASGNRLDGIPSGLAALVRLQTLHLGANLLESLPPWLGGLPELTTLSVISNRLTALPAELGDAASLTALNVTKNALSTLPDSLRRLDGLRSLSLGGNGFGRLPDWLAGLTRLAYLGLSDLGLTEIPAWIGELQHLSHLSLTRNRFTTIPLTLGRVGELRTLFLSDNRQLGAVPWVVGQLIGLESLGLSTIGLEHVPDWLGDLKNLRYLSLGGNELTALPESMARMTALKSLVIADNELETLPEWLGDMQHLTELNISYNPLRGLPPEIASAGTEAVLSYLRARRRGTERQWKSKLVVVGEGRAGKTSLVRSLSREPHNPDEPTTHGMRVTELTLPHPTEKPVEMKLATWDFGGQEIYHATHQFFLTDQSLYVLVWNAEVGYRQARLRYWLDVIQAQAPDAPVVLVATRVAQRSPDAPVEELRRTYPNIKNSFEIDNITGEGVDRLRTAVATLSAQLPLMGVEWPSSWSDAAERLAGHPEPWVSAATMGELMAEAGVRDAEDHRTLSRALHQRGEILHYSDDAALADTVVLQPGWLNGHIARILDSKAIEHGVLTREAVDTAWGDIDRAMRDTFLDLMDKYDISYRITGRDRNEVAIVVNRLPHHAPEYGDRWPADVNGGAGAGVGTGTATGTGAGTDASVARELRVRYEFPSLPPGIPSWFIARENRFATDVRWRYGALLQDHDGRHLARIVADPEEGLVELAVRGPMPIRFFSVLDDGLNQTFGRYANLHPIRSIPCPHRDASGTPCPGWHVHDKLITRMDLGKTSVGCDKCLTDLDIAALLSGAYFGGGAGSEHGEYGEVLNRISHLQSVVEQGTQLTLDKIAEAAALQQLEFLKTQETLCALQETRCPSVFTLTPRHKHKLPGVNAHTLRLYCEEPGAWHPIPGDEGCYQVTDVEEWLRVGATHLAKILLVLGRAAPLVAPVLGVRPEDLHNLQKDDVAKMKALLAHLPTSNLQEHLDAAQHSDDAGWLTPSRRANADADYRAILALFQSKDPEQRWGGLSRKVTPEGLTLFLCRDHLERYRTPARAM